MRVLTYFFLLWFIFGNPIKDSFISDLDLNDLDLNRLNDLDLFDILMPDLDSGHVFTTTAATLNAATTAATTDEAGDTTMATGDTTTGDNKEEVLIEEGGMFMLIPSNDTPSTDDSADSTNDSDSVEYKIVPVTDSSSSTDSSSTDSSASTDSTHSATSSSDSTTTDSTASTDSTHSATSSSDSTTTDSTASTDSIIIETGIGKIRGLKSKKYNLHLFHSIPYAKPPIGPLRFRDPIPYGLLNSNSGGSGGNDGSNSRGSSRGSGDGRGSGNDVGHGVYDATRKKGICPQFIPYTIMSENCLFLDIYRPITTTPNNNDKEEELLPVVIWIHGGGFLIGDGELLSIQNPEYFSHHQNIIVVSIQYRLGALGFLSSDIGTNMAIKDQQLAIQWVSEHIKYFGGNPKQMTIWGESAGAMSIGIHLSIPSSYSLFQKVIMQSPVFGIQYRTLDESKEIYKKYTKSLHCPTIQCLQRKSIFQILYLHKPMIHLNTKQILSTILIWTPVIDHSYISQNPRDFLLQYGVPKSIDVLIGYNKNEAGLLKSFINLISKVIFGRRLPIVGVVYEFLIKRIFRDLGDEVLEMYSGRKYDSDFNMNQLLEVVSDYLCVCPIHRVVSTTTSSDTTNTNSKIFMYEFSYPSKQIPTQIPFFKNCHRDQVCHAMELFYTFHSDQIFEFGGSEHLVSHRMVDLWGGFMKGELGGGGSGSGSRVHDLGRNLGGDYKVVEWVPNYSQSSQSSGHSGTSSETSSQTGSQSGSQTTGGIKWLEFTEDGGAMMRQSQGSERERRCQFWAGVPFDY